MKLLLAEDERSLSKALTAILEHNGYTVDAVYDGVEALEYLEMGEYDGVILDIMMPRMDGMTALQKIREKGNQVPVLMLTAKSEVDDKVAGLDNGANDYLTNPCNDENADSSSHKYITIWEYFPRSGNKRIIIAIWELSSGK